MDYIPICRCAGRQVPSQDMAQSLTSSFRVIGIEAETPPLQKLEEPHNPKTLTSEVFEEKTVLPDRLPEEQESSSQESSTTSSEEGQQSEDQVLADTEELQDMSTEDLNEKTVHISSYINPAASFTDKDVTTFADSAETSETESVDEMGEQFEDFESNEMHEIASPRTELTTEALTKANPTGTPSSRDFELTGASSGGAMSGCTCADCDSAVSPRAYLMDLLDYIQRHVTKDNNAVTLDELTEMFHQPFAELAESCEAAEKQVRQVRICIEVLRSYLKENPHVIEHIQERLEQEEKEYRLKAYTSLLNNFGTSFDEIRLSRTLDDVKDRKALADRLGIVLGTGTPDNLRALLLNPSVELTHDTAISEQNLERLFGLIDTTRSPLSVNDSVPSFLGWQREYLRTQWLESDRTSRETPIIDPDIVGERDLKNPVERDPAFTLLKQRKEWIQDRLNSFNQEPDDSAESFEKWGNDNDGRFFLPSDIAVDARGYVFVADTNNNRIQMFDENGVFIRKWGSYGPLNFPEGIAVSTDANSDVNVYVANTLNHQIQKFDERGKLDIQKGKNGVGEGDFRSPRGITVDVNGNFYVADTNNHRIQKFSSDGIFINQWGENGRGNRQFNRPNDVVIDNMENIYVADQNNHRIQKFDSQGVHILSWRNNGTGEKEFTKPRGLTVDHKDDIYVVDRENNRIQKFSKDGDFIPTKWDDEQASQWQFNRPHGLALDGNGNIYVADTYNNRIQKFNAIGEHISTIGQLREPRGIAVDTKNTIYVVDSQNHQIKVFDTTGRHERPLGSQGDKDGQLYNPSDVAIDRKYNVYVVDTNNHRIQKFNSKGEHILSWGNRGRNDREFTYPKGIALDSKGNVYVADTGNYRIQVFDPTGDDLLNQWRTRDTEDGRQSIHPLSISIDAQDNVYVADGNNDSIQKYDLQGKFSGEEWGSEGNETGQFILPSGVAVAPDGTIYVADTYNNSIQKIIIASGVLTSLIANTLNVPVQRLKKLDSEQKAGYNISDQLEEIGLANNSFSYLLRIIRLEQEDVDILDSERDEVHSILLQFEKRRLFDTWKQEEQRSSLTLSPDFFKDIGREPFEIPAWRGTWRDRRDWQDTLKSRIEQEQTMISAYQEAISSTEKETLPILRDALIKSVAIHEIVQLWGRRGNRNGQFNSPTGIALDSKGNIYVVDQGNNRIQFFDSQGIYQNKWGSQGSGNRQFNSPNDIAIDSVDNIYVADTNNHRIQKLNSSGGYITQWGVQGQGNRQFNFPNGVAVDSDDDVYVADTGNHRVVRFHVNGNGDVTRSGVYLGGNRGNSKYQLNFPRGIVVVPDPSNDYVYVVDTENNRIMKYRPAPDASSNYKSQWGSFGSDDGQFNRPLIGIAADANNNVYVADTRNHRIQQFDTQENFLEKWGRQGDKEEQFNHPRGVAVDRNNYLYVADTGNHRIQKIDLSESRRFNKQARWILNYLLIDPKVSGCQITTRIAQAFETLQGLLWSLRTGQLQDNYSNMELDAENFDEEWKWLGSYDTWRSAMFVFLYPENILLPHLRKEEKQTPAFHTFMKKLRSYQRLTPDQAREAASEYFDTFFDISNLSLKATCWAESAVDNNELFYMFAKPFYGSAIGNVYWSILNPLDRSGYVQIYWQKIHELGKVTHIVGIIVNITSLIDKGFQHTIYLFVIKVVNNQYTMGYFEYNVEEKMWDDMFKILKLPYSRWDSLIIQQSFYAELSYKDAAIALHFNDSIHVNWFNFDDEDWITSEWKSLRISAYKQRALIRFSSDRSILFTSYRDRDFDHYIECHLIDNRGVIKSSKRLENTKDANWQGFFQFWPREIYIFYKKEDSTDTVYVVITINEDNITVSSEHNIRFLGSSPYSYFVTNYGNANWERDHSVRIRGYNRTTTGPRDTLEAHPGSFRSEFSLSGKILHESKKVKITPEIQNQIKITENLSSERIQSLSREAFVNNNDVHESILTYIKEAYYFVPIQLALQLQKSKNYTIALDWFRTVYAYNMPLDKRKVYFLTKDESTIFLPWLLFYRNLDNWLLDPLYPHEITENRPGMYTKFTLLSLIRCLLDYADEEFTRDTSESIPRARTLYMTALDLLNNEELRR